MILYHRASPEDASLKPLAIMVSNHDNFRLPSKSERFSDKGVKMIFLLISAVQEMSPSITPNILLFESISLSINSSQRASLERLHWGSKSIRTVLYPWSASFFPMLKARVVFPTHHLLFVKTICFVRGKIMVYFWELKFLFILKIPLLKSNSVFYSFIATVQRYFCISLSSIFSCIYSTSSV